MGPTCNTLVTTFTIKDSTLACSNLLFWKDYFHIDSKSLAMSQAYCASTDKFIIEWSIIDAVSNYLTMMIIMPQNWVLKTTTPPNLSNWAT